MSSITQRTKLTTAKQPACKNLLSGAKGDRDIRGSGRSYGSKDITHKWGQPGHKAQGNAKKWGKQWGVYEQIVARARGVSAGAIFAEVPLRRGYN